MLVQLSVFSIQYSVTDPLITDPPITDPPITDSPITDPPITDLPITDSPITVPLSVDQLSQRRGANGG